MQSCFSKTSGLKDPTFLLLGVKLDDELFLHR